MDRGNGGRMRQKEDVKELEPVKEDLGLLKEEAELLIHAYNNWIHLKPA